MEFLEKGNCPLSWDRGRLEKCVRGRDCSWWRFSDCAIVRILRLIEEKRRRQLWKDGNFEEKIRAAYQKFRQGEAYDLRCSCGEKMEIEIEKDSRLRARCQNPRHIMKIEDGYFERFSWLVSLPTFSPLIGIEG